MFLFLLLSFALSLRAEADEIFGGHEVRPHSRPYMAYLEIDDQNPTETLHCGGFLIRKDVVLTAAHCNGRRIKVFLGVHNIHQKWKRLKRFSVRATFPHRDYNSATLSNDIMLLKLDRKVKLTKKINLLHLPDSDIHLEPGQKCSVAGWGITAPKGKLSNKLMEVELKVQKEEKCKKLYRNYNPTTQLCAGDERGKNSMEGDSGGPLVCDKVAQGIVSFGNKDGIPPTVYTRISSYLPWIQETLSRM